MIEDNVPGGVSYKEKNIKNFFASLKSLKIRKESDPELDPDPFVKSMDPQIRICSKMSRIPQHR
jgi:hypothetical protein